MRSCTRTNSSPMMWRFCSGSLTPASALRNWLARVLHLDGAAAVPENAAARTPSRPRASGRCPRRRRARGRAPSARRQSVKATVESTPPLTKKKTLRSSDNLADLLLDQRARGASGPSPARSRRCANRKLARISLPARGVDHLGVELHAVEAPRGVRPWRRRGRCRCAPADGSPPAAPRPCRGGSSRSAGAPRHPSNSGSAPSRSRKARPNSPLSPFRTAPPSRWAINCWP